jgi:hypothetical protein
MGGRGGLASERTVPDFFIVGHQKCGTTALYKMLKGHPQIFLPDVKEPRYFLSDAPTPARSAPAATRARKQTLDEYLSLFTAAGPGQLAGEASPQYLRSTTAASAIAELQPDARIVAILREPVAFLRSFHLQMLSNNAEDQRNFGRAIALEDQRRQGTRIPRHCEHPAVLMYSQHVRYAEQLRRFETQFSRENMLVLIYDDYRRDNEQAVRTLSRCRGESPGAPDRDPSQPGRPLPGAAPAGLGGTARAAQPSQRRPAGASGQHPHPRLRSQRGVSRAVATGRLPGAASARRAARGRASPSLRAGGPRHQRVPRSGPGEPVGL